MPYWQLYYHLIWATKNRDPLITSDLEPTLHQYLRGKGLNLGGIVHAVGGIEEHIHVVVSIPPRISVATYIGQLKGASSHWVSHLSGHSDPFAWQDGYGVISFGKRALPQVVEYVRMQREHHQSGQLIAALEWTALENIGP
jgi:putative transposase